MSDQERPVIVTLCGSTRFYDTWQRAIFDETMAGKMVFSVGFYPHSAEQAHGEAIGITPDEKEKLDLLHLEKVKAADEVLILNVGGYIGESTARELAYAQSLGKRVRFWQDENPPPPDDNPVRLRAFVERETALGDATPPEGWGLTPVDGWPV